MKDLLKNKKIIFITALCGLTYIIGIISPVTIKAAQKEDLPTGLDTISLYKNQPAIYSDRTLYLADNIISSLPFIKDSLCFIEDSSNSMSAFINELYSLLNGKDTVINIIHLGDSHIQAGFLSGRTMRLMQNSFGNAGRGWIAPFKLSKLNEPNDYFISSNVKEWISGRCVQLKPKCPWGPGGIGIQTEAKNINFNLIITPNNGAGYSFNKILLYRDIGAAPMSPLDTYKDSAFALSLGNQAYEKIIVDTFITTNLIDTFSIKNMDFDKNENSIKSVNSNSNLYYGFMLANGNPGLLYHSIGVNGAKYKDYTSREYIRQLALLKPSLLIISLGTNESFGRNFSKVEFEMQVNSFVSLVREEIPEVTLLITTPAESYKRVYRNKKRYYERNENIAKVADVISSYTKKEGIACWDLYSVAGGNNSCKNWFDAKMLGRDRIHFSRDGYEEQGVLLYKALVRSYISTHNIPGTNIDFTGQPEEVSADNTTAESGESNAEPAVKSGEEAGNVE